MENASNSLAQRGGSVALVGSFLAALYLSATGCTGSGGTYATSSGAPGENVAASCEGRSLLAGACQSSADCCQGGCAGGSCICLETDLACTSNESCCSNACVDGTCASCRPAGSACSKDVDCCGRSCTDGVCEASSLDEACTSAKDCKKGLNCKIRRCKAEVGEACTDGPNCSSELCDNGACACAGPARGCAVDSDCCDGRQCNNKDTKKTLPGRCFRGKGQACNPSTINDCASGKCTNGACACSTNFCIESADCCNGTCSDGICRSNEPSDCSHAGGVNTTTVKLAYAGGPTESFCGCVSGGSGCDATYFASSKTATLRYTVGDAFHPTVITVTFGGGNDVMVAVNETNGSVPANLRGFYENQHATKVTFTSAELKVGGVVDGAFNDVVLDKGGGATVTLSGTFHSELK